MKGDGRRRLVSVIVPVYKSEKTLERCVTSLLAQTYPELEILLVVEPPPDASGVLAAHLASSDPRVRVFYQKNEGVSLCRNYGLANARGDYIRFVDSDDYVQPDSMQMLVDAMEHTGGELVIAGFHHWYFGRRIEKLPLIGEDAAKKQGLTGGRDQVCCSGRLELEKEETCLYELYQAGFLNMPWNKLYRRELIRRPFARELNLGEDLLFNLSYLQQINHFTVLSAPVYEYIQDDRGTTLSTKRRENKLALTMRLYEQVRCSFEAIYPGHEPSPVLRDKLVSEFMDDVEGLAFEKGMKVADKKKVIRAYEKQLEELLGQGGGDIHLALPDYRIIYFFMKRGQTDMAYLMIWLRGVVVRLLRRR